MLNMQIKKLLNNIITLLSTLNNLIKSKFHLRLTHNASNLISSSLTRMCILWRIIGNCNT